MSAGTSRTQKLFFGILDSVRDQGALLSGTSSSSPIDVRRFAGQSVSFLSSPSEPILPSRIPLASLSAAALGCVGFALCQILRARLAAAGSRAEPEIALRTDIDLHRAALAVRTIQFCKRLDKGKSLSLWDPVSGLYHAGDGRWLQLHCNYPHHRDIALKALDVTYSEDEGLRGRVAEAIKGMKDTELLEEKITSMGGCAAMVRTEEEWAAHPQRSAILSHPLVGFSKIADAAPRPFAPLSGLSPLSLSSQPLHGLKVLDLTHVLAGPTAAKTLAEQGATVLNVSAAHLPAVEGAVIDTGFGKLSCFLDLRRKEDLQTLKDLLKETDILINSYRPGSLEKFGLTDLELHRLRPGIVVVNISAYGVTGPWAGKRGFDSLVQCVSGVAEYQGRTASEAGTPKHLPAQLLDYVTGYLAAFGAMTGILQRAVSGGSYRVDLCLARTCEWMKEADRLDNLPLNASDILAKHELIVKQHLLRTDTPHGFIEHVAPLVTVADTPRRLDLQSFPRGHHPAQWPQGEDEPN